MKQYTYLLGESRVTQSSIVLALAFSLYTAYQFKEVPFYSSFLRSFVIRRNWPLSNGFCASADTLRQFFLFTLLMWLITVIHLQILKQPEYLDEGHLVMMYLLFKFLTLLDMLSFYQGILTVWSLRYSSVLSFSYFWYYRNGYLIKWVRKCSPFFLCSGRDSVELVLFLL